MKSLADYLKGLDIDDGLKKTVFALGEAVKQIAEEIKHDKGEKAGSENIFGEEQVKMDVRANQIVEEKLLQTLVVGLIASEEMDEELKIGDGPYAVAHDPLDGSSLIDVNLAVGSIFGIYRTDTFYGRKGDEQLGAVLGVYGPRTAIFLTVREGLAYFVFDGEQFVLQRERMVIEKEGKMFAPGNLRAAAKRKDYLELLNFWAVNEYKLRYSGGMVPDIGQILLKGHGIFTYPGYEGQEDGKLRVLYECAPMALIIEDAGGKAVDGRGKRILELEIKDLAQRTPILIGSKLEVEIAEKHLV